MSSAKKPLIHRKAADIGLNKNAVPNDVLRALKVLREAGYEAYIVGGAARDMLLGREPADFDVVTNASPEEVREHFRRCRLIGRRFRLAHVFQGRHRIEMSTFRSDVSAPLDGDNLAERNRLNNTYGTMSEDANRRDFIVNCIYYDPHDDNVYMHERTPSDIRARRLTMIGDPAARYAEDPVRMLRAVRLATRLELTIESATREAIPRLAKLLTKESPSRLLDEFIKLFHSGVAVATFEALRELKIFPVLFPLAESNLPPPRKRAAAADEADEDAQYEEFIYAMLGNTDARCAEDKPVVPAFILTGFLWASIEARATQLIAGGDPAYIAVNKASHQAIEEQGRIIAMPRRVSMMVRDICQIQWQLKADRAKVLHRVASHPKFRAGFDFLCLRSRVDLASSALCDWWERYQQCDGGARAQMIQERARSRYYA